MNLKRIILAAALLLPALAPLAAQGLPTLGKAPEITVGELPNGISYYLVSNDRLPGFADFAIVQPARQGGTSPREDLSRLPHFYGRRPCDFLASAGVAYPGRGFIQRLRGATVMRFPRVPVTEYAVYDSTLLMLMDIAQQSEYRQAIIISGDVNVPAVLDRMRTLSLTIPMRKVNDAADSYNWQPTDSAMIVTGTAPVGVIRITYRSPRTDPELMNTIQPVMSKVLASELEVVLRQRLRGAFTAAGIPLADCRFRYTGSNETSGDELFSLTVETSPQRLEDAIRTTAGVLSAIDSDGAKLEEVFFARSALTGAAGRTGESMRLSNQQYVDKCVASYLYGANLASPAELSALFLSRKLELGREKELLNRYMSATLSDGRNLHLYAGSSTKPSRDRVKDLFYEGWNAGCSTPSDTPSQLDTLKLKLPRKKAKLRYTAYDAFSGGKMWTFSNGVTVLFKKTSDKGSFHYGYMVRGGWTEISGITGAETAFVSDVAGLRKVAGIAPDRWNALMEMNGITLDRQVLLSDVRYTGTAPSNRLSLVLKAMLAMAVQSEPDAAAFERYRSEKAVRLVRDRFTAAGTHAVLDSTMSPRYRYAAGSMPALPDATFPERVGSYLQQKGANSRNTVIVLVGDLDESVTLKHLGQVLGGFPVGGPRVIRPRHPYPIRECWTTSAFRGTWRDNGVTVAMSAPWQFTAESNTVLSIACATLEAELTKALSDVGFHFRVSADASLLPAEMIKVYIDCAPVQAAGLPDGISPASNQVALDAVREVINRLAREEVPPQVLARAKAAVSANRSSQAQSSAYMLDLLLYRNSLGRDVGSNWQGRIKAAQASDVQAMFAALQNSKCEIKVQ